MIKSTSRTSALAEAWFTRKAAEAQAGENTLAAYRDCWRVHIEPALGSLRLNELAPQTIDDFLTMLYAKSKAQGRRAKVILVGMVRLGVHYRAMPVDFTGSIVKFGPRDPGKEIRTLAPAEVALMLHAVDTWRSGPGLKGPKPDGQLAQVVRLQLGAALRIGEALALRAMDVHPPAEPGQPWFISVRGTVITQVGKGTFRQSWTKGKKPRTIQVADFAAQVLADRLARIADVDDPEQLIFYSKHNTVLQPNNLRRLWRQIRVQAGVRGALEDVTPHALRRTMATAIASQVSDDVASAFLGHSPGRGNKTLHQFYRRPEEVLPVHGAVLNGVVPPLALTQ